jgi:tetratricopeptide (TPR) repeat protein
VSNCVVGEVLEPKARRSAELAAVDAQLRDHPDNAEALFDRGWLRLHIAKHDEAIADLERALRLQPDDADALFLLDEALADLDLLIQRHPVGPILRDLCSQVHSRLGRGADASAELPADVFRRD